MSRRLNGTEALHIRPADGTVLAVASDGIITSDNVVVGETRRNVRVNHAAFGTNWVGMILTSLEDPTPTEELVVYDLRDGTVTTLLEDARFVDEFFVSSDDVVVWAVNHPGESSFVQFCTSSGALCFVPFFTSGRVVNLRLHSDILFVLQSNGVLDVFHFDRDHGYLICLIQSTFEPILVPWHCATLFHHCEVLAVRTKTTLHVLLDTVKHTLEVPHTRDTSTVWVRFLFGTNAIATNVDESIRVYDVRSLAMLYHMEEVVHRNSMFGGVASVDNKLVVGSSGKGFSREHFCMWTTKMHWLFARSGLVDNAVVRYVLFVLMQLRCPIDVTHCILECWITNRG